MAVWPWISTTTTINSEHEPGAHWVLGVQKPEGLPLYPPGKTVSYHQCVTHDSLILPKRLEGRQRTRWSHHTHLNLVSILPRPPMPLRMATNIREAVRVLHNLSLAHLPRAVFPLLPSAAAILAFWGHVLLCPCSRLLPELFLPRPIFA